MELLFNKVAGLTEFLKTTFLKEHLQATAFKVPKECPTNLTIFHTDTFK